MKRRHLWLVAISLIIAVCMCFSLAACGKGKGETTKPVALTPPLLTLDEDTGIVTWDEVANASGYKYVVNDGAEQTATNRTVTLNDGETVKVKAVGDGTNYTDSAWSQAKTYTAQTSAHTHAYDYTDNGDGTHNGVCNADGECDAKNIENEAHVWGTDNKCEKCGAENKETPVHTHSYVYSDNNNGTHNGHCDVADCDTPDITNQAHEFGADNKCVCGAEKPVPVVSEKAASILFTDDTSRTSQDANSQIWDAAGVKLTNNKASSPSGVAADVNPVRLYAHSYVKIEYAGMVKIVFNCNTATYANALKNSIAAAADVLVTVDTKAVTVEFTAEKNEFEIADLSAQVRLDSIDVYIRKAPKSLQTPANFNIDEYGVVTWDEVENATKYAYRIGTAEPVETETRSVKINNGETIKVWAVGDGEDWKVDNEDVAATGTYTLTTVTLTLSVTLNAANGEVTWTALKGAVKYVYSVTGADSAPVEGKTNVEVEEPVKITLEANQSVKIKAVGDGTVYLDSAEVSKTYTIEEINLDTPVVTVTRGGIVTVSCDNALTFEYTINGTAQTPVANAAGGVTLANALTDNDVIVVTAKGNGSNVKDSATPATVTYKAPQTLVSPEAEIKITGEKAKEVTVSWMAVDGATKYQYCVNDGNLQDVVNPETTTVDGKTKLTVTISLEHRATLWLKAIGDETENEPVIANADYSAKYNTGNANSKNFELDTYDADGVAYYVNEIAKITAYFGTTQSDAMLGVEGVVYSSSYSNGKFTVWLKDTQNNINQAFMLYQVVLGDEVDGQFKTEAFQKADALKNYTVVASGYVKVYNTTKEMLSGTEIAQIIDIRMSDSDKVNYAAEILQNAPAPVPEITDNDYTYTLPLTGAYGTVIEWSFGEQGTGELDAENDVYDNTDGTLIITRRAEDATVKAIAKITVPDYGGCTEVTFELTIAATGGEVSVSIVETLDFTKEFSTYASDWNSTYTQREITFGKTGSNVATTNDISGKATLSNANKQTATITDKPVLCAKNTLQYVTVTIDSGNIAAVTFGLAQWGTKTFSEIYIQYSTDGETWVDCSAKITTPAELASNVTIPDGVKTVRLAYVASTSSNTQLGLSSVTLTVNP